MTTCGTCGASVAEGSPTCGACGAPMGVGATAPDRPGGPLPAAPPRPAAPAPPPTYQPPPAYGASPAYGGPARGTNGLAIASLVLSILFLCGVGSILAVIFGFVARKQISQSGESGDGMALAGIIVGFIGIAALIGYVILVVIMGVAMSSSEPTYYDSGVIAPLFG